MMSSQVGAQSGLGPVVSGIGVVFGLLCWKRWSVFLCVSGSEPWSRLCSILCECLRCGWVNRRRVFVFGVQVDTWTIHCMCGFARLRSEKYRLNMLVRSLFRVFSFLKWVDGWMNHLERGRGIRKSGLALGGERGVEREGKPTCTCGFWIPDTHYCTACLSSANYSVYYRQNRPKHLKHLCISHEASI